MSIKRVFCDVDGVISNFTKSACSYCNIPYPKNTEFSNSWLDDQCGEELWKRCLGEDFWANLDIFPWAYKLVNIIENHTNQWIFITKPHQDPGCYSGKYKWIKRYFPINTSHLWVINGDKNMICKGTGDLLIDDQTKNLAKWKESGGTIYHWIEVTPDYPINKIEQRLWNIQKLLIYAG